MSENEQGVEIPIEWDYSENTSRYATNLIVQHTEHEFILSFFEIKPPILLGSPEEQAQKALEIKSIKAKCVARVVISAGRMPDFLRVLQDNLNKYQARSDQEE